MPSTYSDLKIQLMATGENNTTWGNVTNTNLGTALEEAIVGSADVTFASGNVTLTLTDTNTTQTARNVRLRCTGTTGGTTRNLVVPSIEKPYIIQNDCADSILVKTAAGTGVTVPAGKTMWVYSDATNVVDVVTHLSGLTLNTALAVTQGGTGATSASGARTNLGLGTLSTQNANSVAITGGSVTGITDIAIADGGTGASTAADARTNLGLGALAVLSSINNSNWSGTALAIANGGTGAADAATARTNLGATTVGGNLFTLTNPSAITFPRFNADNTVSALNAADFRTAIGVGTGTGTVTSVNASGGTTGLAFTGGPVTTSGTLTLGGTLAVAHGGTGTTTSTGTGAVVRAVGPAIAGLTMLGGGGEGGQISLNDAADTATKYTFDVDASGHGRLFTTQNNTNLTIGQIGGTGGFTAFSTEGSERMRITAAGNVGVGTNTPGVRLDVVGPALTPATQNTYALWVANSGGANGDLAFGSNSGASLIQSFGAKPLRINGIGNAVVVGGNPAAVYSGLTVATDIAIQQAQPLFNFVNAAGSTRFGYIYHTGAGGSFDILNQQNGPMTFGTNNLERVRIDAAGNVGVGNTGPSQRLDVSGSGNFVGNVFISNGSGAFFNGSGSFSIGIASVGTTALGLFTGNAERMRITSTGAITSADLADAVGYKGVPGASVTSGTLTNAQMGQCVPATGNVTAPSGTFSRGFTFSIYNDSASDISIVQGSGLTLRLAGTTTTGTRTLAARGMAVIWYNSASEAIVSGAGVS